jgi:hypothetical protein
VGEGGLNLCPSQWNWKDECQPRALRRLFAGSFGLDLSPIFFYIVLTIVTHFPQEFNV